MGAAQQVGKLTARRAGLGQQLGARRLEELPGEQEAGLQENALPGLDHAEAGNGGGHGGIHLDTARRKILQGQPIALPTWHGLRPGLVCEIYSVKFLL